MSEFITKFNRTLEHGIAGTRRKLTALKTATDRQKDNAEDVVGRYLEMLDTQITVRSRKLEKLEEKIEDWVLNRSEKTSFRKDELGAQDLIDQAAHAQRKAVYAFDKVIIAIDVAEGAMLRSKIAHSKAGITIQGPQTALDRLLKDRKEELSQDG